jgi:F1F0 ATPase subunit 2
MAMDAQAMSEPALSLILHGSIGLAAGFAVGLVHFGSLWLNARMFTRSGRLPAAFALQLGRFVILIAVCVGLTQLGALSLLLGAAGLLLARGVILRRVGVET